MTEPSCLNEIPKVYFEEGDTAKVELKDVQSLVCRRIIFLQRPNVEEDEVIIRDYKYLFNITDAMIEEERKRAVQ